MDSGKVLLLGGLAVGGYFAYQWYYGSGGYADRQICAAAGLTAAQLHALAAQVNAAAAAANTTAAAYLSSIAASTNAQTLACARVAIAQYPTAVAATASTAAGSTATSSAATSSAATGSAATGSTATSTPAPGTNSLDSVYAALLAAATAAGINVTAGTAGGGLAVGPDGWNSLLGSVYILPGGTALPDPSIVFAGVDRSKPMTLAAYWSVMSPWLASNAGLSGLGVFGGLGALARAYGGRS
jgi:hypothetical protein